MWDEEKIEELDKKVAKGKKKLTKKKKIIIITSIVLGVLLIAGTLYFFLFMNKEKPVKVKPKPKVEKKLTIVDQDSKERPIAVMIDNNIGQGRHAGLQDSIINYEIIVEGGLTRIMAVFKDHDIPLVGPVRSARHYFLDYALESDAIYVHFGWSPAAEKDISALRVNNINGIYDSVPFWRDQNIAAPHNVFSDKTKMYDGAKAKNYRLTSEDWLLLNYTTDEVVFEGPKVDKETKEPVEEDKRIISNSISIPYSGYQNRSYTYDAEKKVYLRSMNGVPHMDKTTGLQLNYKNIIIEKVQNRNLDSSGRQDLDTVGTGVGYYITNGYAMEITWSKSARNAKTEYKFLDGKKIKVNDGNTFIHIIPVNSEVSIGQ